MSDVIPQHASVQERLGTPRGVGLRLLLDALCVHRVQREAEERGWLR